MTYGYVALGRRDAGLRERTMGVDSPLRRLDWVLAQAGVAPAEGDVAVRHGVTFGRPRGRPVPPGP